MRGECSPCGAVHRVDLHPPRIDCAGQVTEQCILYSALDATIREYDLTVPRDAVAHIHPDLAEAALKMIELNMHGDVVDGEDAVGS